MMNPFKKFKSKDPKEDKHVKLISAQSWVLTKKVATGKLTVADVREYEKLVNAYYKDFPDKDRSGADERIRKLKIFAK